MALCKPATPYSGMDLSHGGHLTHGSPANFSGKFYNIVPYGCDPATGRIDYDAVRDLALKHRPRMIVAGASAYPRAIDFERFAEIAHEAGRVPDGRHGAHRGGSSPRASTPARSPAPTS